MWRPSKNYKDLGWKRHLRSSSSMLTCIAKFSTKTVYFEIIIFEFFFYVYMQFLGSCFWAEHSVISIPSSIRIRTIWYLMLGYNICHFELLLYQSQYFLEVDITLYHTVLRSLSLCLQMFLLCGSEGQEACRGFDDPVTRLAIAAEISPP